MNLVRSFRPHSGGSAHSEAKGGGVWRRSSPSPSPPPLPRRAASVAACRVSLSPSRRARRVPSAFRAHSVRTDRQAGGGYMVIVQWLHAYITEAARAGPGGETSACCRVQPRAAAAAAAVVALAAAAAAVAGPGSTGTRYVLAHPPGARARPAHGRHGPMGPRRQTAEGRRGPAS